LKQRAIDQRRKKYSRNGRKGSISGFVERKKKGFGRKYKKRNIEKGIKRNKWNKKINEKNMEGCFKQKGGKIG